MPLALRVLSHHGHSMGTNGVRVFEAGGTIGRTADNDWMLPDPERFVSSQHALITYEAGRYFLTDRSRNGTAVNGREVPKGGRVELRAGDRLKIGTYEIAVSMEQARVMAPPPRPDASGPRYEPFSSADPFFDPSPIVSEGHDPTLDPLVALGVGAPPKPTPPPPPYTQDDHASAESEFFEPPRFLRDPTPPPGRPEIPENWDQTGFTAPEQAASPEPRPGPTNADPFPPSHWDYTGPKAAPRISKPAMPPPAPITPSPTGGDVAVLLAAAGVDPSKVDAATLGTLGEVLRVVVEGVMRTLKARAETKNQFRVAMTTLKPVDNNPLKFSKDVNEALANLFGRRHQSFQTPVDAFRDAFDDLRDHQLAVMAGMRAAFMEVMRRFDPDELQEAFDGRAKRNALFGGNKPKYWELYREMYESLGDDDEKFKRLFGDEFAQAYEHQMQRLASVRRKR